MSFDPATFGPRVGFVVMIDVGPREARLGLVDDDPNVLIDPHGPEVWIAAVGQPMHL